jgi:hypothetical protein
MSYEHALGPSLIIKHTGQVFPLTQQPVTIGRGAGNTLILADPEVSGYHATIFWQGDLDLFIIQDLGSTSGTFVNGHRVIEPQPLRHGDLVQMGNTLVDIRLEKRQRTVALPPGNLGLSNPNQDLVSGSSRLVLPGVIIMLLTGITIACLILVSILLLGGSRGVPTVVIQTPADGAQVFLGDEVSLQATASSASDITLLELSVDGNVIETASSPDPSGRSALTVSRQWRFVEAGRHSISAVAYTAGGKASKTESVEVEVARFGEGAQPSATALSTSVAEATSTPTSQPSLPQIEYFRAIPEAINAGECTTLQWGQVALATEAKIEPDVGGVATPGSHSVCPIKTTTYVLTAAGSGGTTTAAITVSVSGELADLIVESISLNPNPAVQAQDTDVEITIRNRGAGKAGAFNWDWQAGPDARFNGRLGGLGPQESAVVAIRWRPVGIHANLKTVARVDIANEVPETDKSNNQLVRVVQILPAPVGPGTVTQQSDPLLDGYRGSSGGGGTGQDIIVGNGGQAGTTTEKVWRGFMSFDLSDIPAVGSIEGAQLRFYQVKVEGAPYQKLGTLVLEHVSYGSKLNRAAYDSPSLGTATLVQQSAPGTWYNIVDQPIASWIAEDLAAGRDRFQVRLRWAQETDGDNQEDYVSIEPGNNFFGTGNLPTLAVTYGP